MTSRLFLELTVEIQLICSLPCPDDWVAIEISENLCKVSSAFEIKCSLVWPTWLWEDSHSWCSCSSVFSTVYLSEGTWALKQIHWCFWTICKNDTSLYYAFLRCFWDDHPTLSLLLDSPGICFFLVRTVYYIGKETWMKNGHRDELLDSLLVLFFSWSQNLKNVILVVPHI